MTDRNLEEAIYQLQKLNTENGVKQLVEEAARLFASGRHMEAGALMEKAEAMIARQGNGDVTHTGSPTPATPSEPGKAGDAAKMEEQVVVRVAVKLADGLARILSGAFQELERHVIGESRKLGVSFEQQLVRLQSTVDSLGQMQVRFDQVVESIAEQKSAVSAMGKMYDQLSGTVISLQEVSARHATELGTLRGEATALREETGGLRTETTRLRAEAKEFSTGLIQQMDGLSARVGLHQEELTGLKSTVSEISRKVAGFIDRVDRQSEVIRSLSDNQTRRAAALDEMLGVLTRLKTPDPVAAAAAAGSHI